MWLAHKADCGKWRVTDFPLTIDIQLDIEVLCS